MPPSTGPGRRGPDHLGEHQQRDSGISISSTKQLTSPLLNPTPCVVNGRGPQPCVNDGPAVRLNPLDKSNHSEPLLSVAFPTLFLHGMGEYVKDRPCKVIFTDWVSHAMRWYDGRFARHQRFIFIFICLNAITRERIRKSSSFVAKHHSGDGQGPSISLPTSEDGSVDPAQEPPAIPESSSSSDDLIPASLRPQSEDLAQSRVSRLPETSRGSQASVKQPSLEELRTALKEDAARKSSMPSAKLLETLLSSSHSLPFSLHHIIYLSLFITFSPADYHWQDRRGSTHNDGVVWCRGVPAADMSPEEKRAEFAEFWSKHIVAVNLNPMRGDDETVDPLVFTPDV
ncbi:hypothetical protein F5Y14DRAFT_448885 [Nemania sp. NC0429]|nr:hypothetical protein F5Y14DRAFT_448885 [Nemania sp. NC0429]